MSIKLLHIILFIGLVWQQGLFAQLPSSDLYSFTFEELDSTLEIREAKFLNGFNKGGYNNQASFSAENKIFISSNHYNSEKTDIIELDLDKNRLSRITNTDVPEYSPTLHPDGKSISTVRVEADNTTQSLWIYPKDRSNYGYRILSDISDIGYHLWVSETEVILFRLPAPFTMSLVNIETEQQKLIIDNIGRCFKMTPDGEVLFVHKSNPTQWWLKTYNLETRRIETLFPTLENSEDFEILADGRIVMGKDAQLHIRTLSGEGEWNQWTDLSTFGINNIKRLAIQNNRMIITNAN